MTGFPSEAPVRRVVLLGASNLTRGLSTAVETARLVWERPLDVLAALGHGRAYSSASAMLWRELPGIAESGLWASLAQRPRLPTAALLTDVGNDLLLEMLPWQVARAVEECVDRLQGVGACVVLTPLPLESVAALSPTRFLVLRSILYPTCRLRLPDLLERARELDERLRDLARARGLTLVDHRRAWYGFDPIHIRRHYLARAWRELMSPWSSEVKPPLARGSLRRWLYLRSLAPERRWLFGREYRRTQPAGRLPDGTVVSLY
jgi:hypothetical protein